MIGTQRRALKRTGRVLVAIGANGVLAGTYWNSLSGVDTGSGRGNIFGYLPFGVCRALHCFKTAWVKETKDVAFDKMDPRFPVSVEKIEYRSRE
jgi:hypothetical protein